MTGKFAVSRAGHDKGRLYVIIKEEADCVYLCDGRLKTVEKPKKKLLKHIQIINRTVEQELLASLANGEKVQNEQIKYAIKNCSYHMK